MSDPTASPSVSRTPRRRFAGGASPAAQDTFATAANSGMETATPTSRARFRFFIVDSGWNSPAARVIRENFEKIREFQDGDPLYVLSKAQSTEILRRNPHFIGKDPIIFVRDMNARGPADGDEYHGFHLNLGVIKDPIKALAALQEFLNFLAAHRHSLDIERDIRQKLHRDGLVGMIEVIREGAKDAMGGG
ncbi:MAG TPA: hypothetical protein VNL74_01605 [Methylococcus sp.]|nr:hypothetical protein [Methylococcus sp.]